MPAEFYIKYDISTEGCYSFWEAHALIVKEAGIDPAEIHSVEYVGDAANGWPEIAVTFNCIETAKIYTATYFGTDLNDQEVKDYIKHGTFIY